MVCVPLGAQTTHRDSVLTRARYLKSHEQYLKFVRPGTKGYVFAVDNMNYLKGELFMTATDSPASE